MAQARSDALIALGQRLALAYHTGFVGREVRCSLSSPDDAGRRRSGAA